MAYLRDFAPNTFFWAISFSLHIFRIYYLINGN